MNILLTSVGRRTYMVHYFKKALENKGLVYASNSILTYTMYQADKYVLTPSIYDSDYIEFLISYCKKENISVIISLFDIDLLVLSKNKRKFSENGINVIVSDESVINVCNDKWLTYRVLRKLGVKCPKTYINLPEVENDINLGNVQFPLIIKPRWGMGSIGIFVAENIEELRLFYQKIHNIIFSTYIKYESSMDEENCVLIQEKICGDEYGIDIFNDLKGNFVTTIAKQKIAMRAGETDVATIVDSCEFIEVAKILSNYFHHIGNMDVDCFKTSSGDIYVLELNCRFGGQYPFSHNAGVDFPKQIINWLEGKYTDLNLVTPEIGVTSCKELVPVVFKS